MPFYFINTRSSRLRRIGHTPRDPNANLFFRYTVTSSAFVLTVYFRHSPAPFPSSRTTNEAVDHSFESIERGICCGTYNHDAHPTSAERNLTNESDSR